MDARVVPAVNVCVCVFVFVFPATHNQNTYTHSVFALYYTTLYIMYINNRLPNVFLHKNTQTHTQTDKQTHEIDCRVSQESSSAGVRVFIARN